MKIVIEGLERVQMPASNGRDAWTSLRVKFNGKVASCGTAQWNSTWKVGDEVDIEIFEKAGKDGKVWLNIAPPAKAQAVREANEMRDQLNRIEDKLDKVLGNKPRVL